MSIILTLVVFTLIVVIHEWGHFIMARHHGIRVEEFAIGMGPALWKHRTKKDMIFSIRILPIGGFCKMKGEEAEEGEEPDEDSFTAKSPGARASIAAAGPAMNFVLAFVLLLIFNLIYGYADTKVQMVEADYPAAQAGLEAGDRIVELNGENVHVYNKISFLLMNYQAGDEVEVLVEKSDGTEKTLRFALKYDEENERYRMGFTAGRAQGIGEEIAEKGFFKAVWNMLSQSFWYLCFEVELTVRSFAMLFTGKIGLDAVAGPIGMVSVVGETYEAAASYGFMAILSSMSSLMVLLSANLGVLNLFPVPGLDGSRLVFLALEKIRKKPLNPKLENAIYLVGFILLFGLMAVVALNDVLRLFA